MRILMTVDTVSGVWNYALTLSDALVRHGVEVTLATMGAPLSDDQRAEVSLLGIDYFESHFKLEWMEDPWEDLRSAGRWLLDLHRLIRPDLIHLNSYIHASLPWAAPTLITAHSCVHSWWRALKRQAPPPEWDRYHREVQWGLRSADLVVSPTQAMLDALRECYGWMPQSMVIPHGRDPQAFAPAAKEPFILIVGRMDDAARNLGAMRQLAPRLAWPVYLVGDTRTVLMNNGMDDPHDTHGMRVLGRLSTADMAQWMSRASIYIHPARYEPFGLSVLEAAMAGCALVLGDIPSLRELWQDKAIFVHPGDAAGLERAMSELIADDTRRAALGEEARAHAMRYTAQQMARQYLDVYHGLIYRHRISFVSGHGCEPPVSRHSAMSRR